MVRRHYIAPLFFLLCCLSAATKAPGAEQETTETAACEDTEECTWINRGSKCEKGLQSTDTLWGLRHEKRCQKIFRERNSDDECVELLGATRTVKVECR